MNAIIIALLIFGVAVVVFVWATYNDLATLRVRIRAAVQEIGNQLKRQIELIPNLEKSAKAYLGHEKGIYSAITEARKAASGALESADIEKMAHAAQALNKALSPLFALFESNPEIKGAEVVGKLMEELRDTSDKVMYSRRLLIELSAEYNTKFVTFPSNLIASSFGFQKETGLKTPEPGVFLEVTAAETKTPEVKL